MGAASGVMRPTEQPPSPYFEAAELTRAALNFDQKNGGEHALVVSPKRKNASRTLALLSPKSLLRNIPERFSPSRLSPQKAKRMIQRKNASRSPFSPKRIIDTVLASPKKLIERLSPKRSSNRTKDKRSSMVSTLSTTVSLDTEPDVDIKAEAGKDEPTVVTAKEKPRKEKKIVQKISGRRCSFHSPSGKIEKSDSLLDFRKKLRRISMDGAVVKERSSKVLRRFDDISDRSNNILERAKLAASKFNDLIETGNALQRGTANQRWAALKSKMKDQRLARPSGTVLGSRRKSVTTISSKEKAIAVHPNQETDTAPISSKIGSGPADAEP